MTDQIYWSHAVCRIGWEGCQQSQHKLGTSAGLLDHSHTRQLTCERLSADCFTKGCSKLCCFIAQGSPKWFQLYVTDIETNQLSSMSFLLHLVDTDCASDCLQSQMDNQKCLCWQVWNDDTFAAPWLLPANHKHLQLGDLRLAFRTSYRIPGSFMAFPFCSSLIQWWQSWLIRSSCLFLRNCF